MAQPTLRVLNHHSKPFHGMGLFVLLLLMQGADATQFKVGGASGWSVPSDPSAYNIWAEHQRFKIGDSLLFVYPPDKDSVLQVNKDDYASCNTKSPITPFHDGNTSFMFNQSGAYYFISGNEGNCLKNESMLVIVMANRSNLSSSNTTTISSPPPPSPTPYSSPPEMNPLTPPPSASPPAEQTTSPPPPPPRSSSNSMAAVSFVGSVGLLGSTILLVL